MRAAHHGCLTRPAVAVVGVWDPFSPSHRSLLEELRDHARARGCSSLAVLIDPPPGTFSSFCKQYGVSGWPTYDGVSVRTRFLLDLGIDGVLCMRFRKRDFDAKAAEFLDVLRGQVQIEELWLGALQHFGTGRAGARAAIVDYATRHGLALRHLPLPPVGTYDIRSFLASGRVAEAIEQVGHPPTWKRPSSGALRLAWRPGAYRAVPLPHPGVVPEAAPVPVNLVAQPHGPPKLTWPDRKVKYLAFVTGPADQTPARSDMESVRQGGVPWIL